MNYVVIASEPSWLKIAREELGQKEISGSASNPRIIEYHRATTLRATTDEVPWCAAFVSWCLEQGKLPSTKSAAAISYAGYGDPLSTPILGCIAVFRRTGGNHVGFYMGEDAQGRILILGGNQGNAVTIAPQRKENLIGYRWPAGYPTGVKVPLLQPAPEPLQPPVKRGWLSRLFNR